MRKYKKLNGIIFNGDEETRAIFGGDLYRKHHLLRKLHSNANCTNSRLLATKWNTQRHNRVSVSNDKYYSRSSPILITSEFHRRSPSSQDSIETPPLSSYSSKSSQSLIGGIPLDSSALNQSQSLIGGIPLAVQPWIKFIPPWGSVSSL